MQMGSPIKTHAQLFKNKNLPSGISIYLIPNDVKATVAIDYYQLEFNMYYIFSHKSILRHTDASNNSKVVQHK